MPLAMLAMHRSTHRLCIHPPTPDPQRHIMRPSAPTETLGSRPGHAGRPMWSVRSTLLLVPALAFAACSGGPDAPALPEITRTVTEGGWERLTYAATPVGPVDTLRVDLEIGSLDGSDGGFVLGDVRGLEVTAEGEILVLDHQASEVHAFDAEGNHLGVRVSGGEGPFEITTGNGLFLDSEDALWINDHGKRRLTRLLPYGEVKTYPFPGNSFGYVWEGVVADDGVLWEPDVNAPGGVNRELGVVRLPLSNWMRGFEPESNQVDSVWIGTSESAGIRVPGGVAGVPFAPSRLTVIDPRGAFWTASSDEFTLTRISNSGDTLLQVELPGTGPAITSEQRAAEIARIDQFMERAGRISIDWDELFPSHKPILTRLVGDDEGNVWAMRETESGWMADVISATGEYLGRHVLDFEPTRFYPPVVRAGWFLTIRQGEFEEQYVVGSRVSGR